MNIQVDVFGFHVDFSLILPNPVEQTHRPIFRFTIHLLELDSVARKYQ